jgi:salicylate hydroxylase
MLRIAIIGAGIGGLAAACALRQHGFAVTIYERAAEIGEVGAGLQLGPNAVKVLRALGVFDALGPLAFEPTNIVSLAWDDGHLRFRERSGRPRQHGSARPTSWRIAPISIAF